MNGLRIDENGMKGLKLSLKALADPRLPFIEDALKEGAQILSGEIRARAPGGISSKVAGGYIRQGAGGAILATVSVSHPGARAMEFGRTTYYGGFKGNNRPGSKRTKGGMKAGHALMHVRGQSERAYVGIKRGDAAIGATQPRVEEIVNAAILAEWERKKAGN